MITTTTVATSPLCLFFTIYLLLMDITHFMSSEESTKACIILKWLSKEMLKQQEEQKCIEAMEELEQDEAMEWAREARYEVCKEEHFLWL